MRAAHRAPRRTTHRPRRAAAVRRSGRGQRDARERACCCVGRCAGCGIGGRTRDARERAGRAAVTLQRPPPQRQRALQMQRSFVREKRKPGRRARQAARAAQAIRIAPARSNACRAWISVVRARAHRSRPAAAGRAATAASAVRAGSAGSPCCRRRAGRPSPRAATCATPDRRSRGTPRTVRRARREGRRDMRLHVDGERVLRAMQRRLVLLADDRCADGRDRAARDARPDGRVVQRGDEPRAPARVGLDAAERRRSRSRPRARAGRARPPAVPKLTMPAQPRAVASVSARSRRSARAAKTASTPSPRAMRASNAIPVTAMTGNEPVDCGATRYSRPSRASCCRASGCDSGRAPTAGRTCDSRGSAGRTRAGSPSP